MPRNLDCWIKRYLFSHYINYMVTVLGGSLLNLISIAWKDGIHF